MLNNLTSEAPKKKGEKWEREKNGKGKLGAGGTWDLAPRQTFFAVFTGSEHSQTPDTQASAQTARPESIFAAISMTLRTSRQSLDRAPNRGTHISLDLEPRALRMSGCYLSREVSSCRLPSVRSHPITTCMFLYSKLGLQSRNSRILHDDKDQEIKDHEPVIAVGCFL